LIGHGEMFGQEEVLKDFKKRESMAVCASEKCKVFVLDK
jgi:CRP-like cAMP-binding protein